MAGQHSSVPSSSSGGCVHHKGSAVHSVFRAGLLEFRKMRLARNHHVFD